MKAEMNSKIDSSVDSETDSVMDSKVDGKTDASHYVKILREDLTHNGFKYKEGLNIDFIPFNPSGTCNPGGLYFTDLENFHEYLGFGTLIANVTLPDDAKVYSDPCGTKWKADKIIISNIREIRTLPCWRDKAFCEAHKNDYECYRYIKYHEELDAICENPIKYTISIYKSTSTLKYIIALLTEKNNIRKLTEFYRVLFVYYKRNFITDTFSEEELIKIAEYVPKYMMYVKNVPDDFIKKMIAPENPKLLQLVPITHLTQDLCNTAFMLDEKSFDYIPKEFKTDCMIAKKVVNGEVTLQEIKRENRTQELCEKAVEINGFNIQHVPRTLLTIEMCKVAIRQNYKALEHIPNKFKELL